jgi:hypothetical protein
MDHLLTDDEFAFLAALLNDLADRGRNDDAFRLYDIIERLYGPAAALAKMRKRITAALVDTALDRPAR